MKASSGAVNERTALSADVEQLIAHVTHKATTLPPGSTIAVDAGNNRVAITTPAAQPGQAPAPLDPVAAVLQYIKAGLTPAAGMPTLLNLQWLLSLSVASRFAWGAAVAVAFAQQLTTTSAVQTNVPGAIDDIGTLPDAPIRPEAYAYLQEVSQGAPIVGTCTTRELSTGDDRREHSDRASRHARLRRRDRARASEYAALDPADPAPASRARGHARTP